MRAKILINSCLVLFICLTAFLASAARDTDEVTDLPFYPLKDCPGCKMWSGSLAITGGSQVHYIFMANMTQADKPIIVVMPGGPGCSVLYTFLKGVGPFLLHDRETIITSVFNKNTWIQFAHLLFLEGVPGVGFSTSSDVVWDDKILAVQLYEAYAAFKNYFPEFNKNPLHLFGEGYGGNFAALLADQLVTKKDNATLKTVIMGNSDVYPTLREDQYFAFLAGRGIINLDLWEIIEKVCANDDSDTPRCQFAKKTAVKNQQRLNPFDLYRYCSGTESNTDDRIPVESSTRCLDVQPMVDYFNQATVKAKLHVLAGTNYQYCSQTVIKAYKKNSDGVLEELYNLLKNGVRVLAYTGDATSLTPVQYTETWIKYFSDEYEFPLTHDENWYPYREEKEDPVFGFATKYEQNLTFATIRGAGHFASQWKGAETSYVVDQFINNEDL